MKHQVGDKVRVKSLEWYESNKNKNNIVKLGNGAVFADIMREYCGKELIIVEVYEGFYKTEGNGFCWYDDMFEEKSSWIQAIIDAAKTAPIVIEPTEDGGIKISPMKEDSHIGTHVVCSNNTDYWILGFYKGNGTVSERIDGKSESIKFDYIIPFDKFNPKNIKESIKYNISK